MNFLFGGLIFLKTDMVLSLTTAVEKCFADVGSTSKYVSTFTKLFYGRNLTAKQIFNADETELYG